MRYIYGPVSSRRLGFSLGVSLTPYKTCNFDCVYCQLGPTLAKTTKRKEYIKISYILEELKSWFNNNPETAEKLDYITFSGFGEPALNLKISLLIGKIKKITSVPVAVITNASLLASPKIRFELSGVNLVMPSLDAADTRIFRKIDRPLESIKLESIIRGLIAFRKEFQGKIWLEVMLAHGINDSLSHIVKLKSIITKINPDKIQLNSPVRSTAAPGILPAGKEKLKKFKKIFGSKCEII